MRNKLLIFLGIFIFIIIPKNVYAEQINPYYVKLNDKIFIDGPTPTNNYLSSNISTNTTYSLDFYITAYSNESLNIDMSFTKYPYVLLFFQSSASESELVINKNTSCSSSCFNLWNTSMRSLGKNPLTNANQYVLILRPQKWVTNYGANLGATITYDIVDSFTFRTNTNSSKSLQFGTILLSDTDQISNVNEMQTMITNATQNTQNIINNQNQNQQQTNQKLDNLNDSMQDLNDTMKDETGVPQNDVSSKTSEWSNKLAGTGPVSQMVLMPITLLNGYVSGMNATCQPYNLGNLMGTDIILPCINVSNYLGTTLWGVIDVLFSGFMIYAIGKKFVKIFNDFTNLRDNQIDDLYGGGK